MFRCKQSVSTIQTEATAQRSALATWLPANLCHIVVEYGSSIVLFERFNKLIGTDTQRGTCCNRHARPGITLCLDRGHGSFLDLHGAISVQRKRGDLIMLAAIDELLITQSAVHVSPTLLWDWLAHTPTREHDRDELFVFQRFLRTRNIDLLARVHGLLRDYFSTATAAAATATA